MTHIRHRSVKPPMLALLEIRGYNTTVTQEVIVTTREGATVTVEHANGWTRTLQTKSGNSDGGVYVETDTRTPREITFRLLTVEDTEQVA